MTAVKSHQSHRANVFWVTAGALLMAAPFYWLLISSLKYQSDVLAYPPVWFPKRVRLENFSEALGLLSPRAFFNSLVFTVLVTTLQLVLVITTGFALAKMNLPGGRSLFRLFVATMLVPFNVLLIPVFIVVRQLHMLDTYQGLILPIVAQTAFGVFIYRQFFISMPDELLNSARIDGANWGQIFRHIVLPLAGPPTAAYVSVTTLNAWNMYVWPLVAIQSADLRVLPLSLAPLGDPYSLTAPNVAMMAALLSAVPVFIIFLLTQRWFVYGLGGAMKD